ncbi:MAG: hypothetical protein ACOCU3_01880, partial [bacterium]
ADENTANRIIIIHLKEDEVRRRINEFNAVVWPKYSKQLFVKKTNNNKSKHVLEDLKKEFINIFENYDIDEKEIREKLLREMNDLSVSVKRSSNDGSMPREGMAEDLEARKLFIDTLINNTSIMKSVLHIHANEFKNNIIILENYSDFELLKQNILDFVL